MNAYPLSPICIEGTLRVFRSMLIDFLSSTGVSAMGGALLCSWTLDSEKLTAAAQSWARDERALSQAVDRVLQRLDFAALEAQAAALARLMPGTGHARPRHRLHAQG